MQLKDSGEEQIDLGAIIQPPQGLPVRHLCWHGTGEQSLFANAGSHNQWKGNASLQLSAKERNQRNETSTRIRQRHALTFARFPPFCVASFKPILSPGLQPLHQCVSGGIQRILLYFSLSAILHT